MQGHGGAAAPRRLQHSSGARWRPLAAIGIDAIFLEHLASFACDEESYSEQRQFRHDLHTACKSTRGGLPGSH